MSDDESSGYDSGDSYKTVKELRANLESLTAEMKKLDATIHELESAMNHLHRPLESLHIDQFGTVPFLESSPFRNQTFAVKPPGFPGVQLDKRYPFHTICAMLRTYLFATNAVLPDGTVQLTKSMKQLFELKDDTTTFLDLILHLRRILL